MVEVLHNNLAMAMRLVKPVAFDTNSVFLKENTWLYIMVQIFTLVRATNNALIGDVAL